MDATAMSLNQGVSDNNPSTPGPSMSRPPVSLGRNLPGRIALNPPPPPGRLSSLRSRDLTLGGFKKKTFTPNVHSVRKTKDEFKEEPPITSKREKRDKDDRQRESRGKKRDRPQTIQSHSIFEQGPADTTRRIGSWDSIEVNESEPPQVLKFIKKETHLLEDDANEILHKLKRDNFLDDPGLKNDSKHRPIQLPLAQSRDLFAADEVTLNREFQATTMTDVTRSRAYLQKVHQIRKGFSITNQPQPTIAELFQKMSLSTEDELLFIQLPDTIPGQSATTSEKISKTETKPEEKHSLPFKSHDTLKNENTPTLADFTEGHIGKIQIRKSGRVQLVLGEVALDVSEGAAFSFLQQLVSIRLSEGRTGDLTILGNVKHKLVCSPDFEALLKEVNFASQTNSRIL
ncbi:DNA-directed RNA polymerase III subunit RPC4 [Polypterus senegalus]|uniref:DNA-directed RNA polymerase III subunit RPC4 n=1 Tax=Polypterus senegalus TaxID=55291 RepID=UPI0019635674|nr:DNA-directed RNA polymerase III subunit RPC4 [Polypterus senegalus]